MAKRTQKQREIEQHAMRLYGLIRAERDEEALSTLIALGPNMVAVAHALILGDFRTSPAMRAIGRASDRAVRILLAVVPIIICMFVPVPSGWNGLFLRILFYVAVAGAAYLVEAICVIFWVVTYNEPQAVRAVEAKRWSVAVRALATSELGDVNVIAALLDASDVGLTLSYVRTIDAIIVLESQLPGCLGPALNRLNSKQREELYDILKYAAFCDSKRVHISFDPTSAGPEDYSLLVPAVPRHAALATAIVNAYEYVHDDIVIARVTHLAELDFQDISEKWLPVIEAAKRVLPIMKERASKMKNHPNLLRGSQKPADDDDLLRPNPPVFGGDDDLLRPAE